ncbi:MAG: CDP-diacylglycerol--serine O-phosphatidyltransferase [Gracilimonas sp.]|uniref:CDP-diacylglycerol--serine O-phosphatidyltransferase n=1 Tax=Gracilimonas TaxID=649462 RepID=UPI001B18A2D3|nr:CDP-diacylglycerol--serine O-phosphatidyltransferase [Gracilimonas sp.]MBO6586457.1 CDP-diacylglycerol--serine O-phosphatidyltransferase [Gracilimonas sp.]MBO6615114.1 CDP-diacylglycerol--serine O-phosphatidyltransferase [Gracilimonas sp.]
MKYPIQKKYHSFKQRRQRRKEQKPPVNKKIAVPSFFTLMNLFSGFLAIISISNGDFIRGAWLIALAGLFDVFDGLMARLANATSDFGIELDSISDMVSFGVAPGFLIYSWSLHELGFVGIMVSALPPLCGAVRLARFNVNARLHPRPDFFVGLPIPAQAIILGAFFLTFRDSMELFSFLENGVNSVLIPFIVVISFLMVSTLPFDKIPRFDRQTIKEQKGKFVLFLVYLVLILAFKEYGLMAVFTLFMLKGIIVGAIQFFTDDYGPAGVDEFQDYS